MCRYIYKLGNFETNALLPTFYFILVTSNDVTVILFFCPADVHLILATVFMRLHGLSHLTGKKHVQKMHDRPFDPKCKGHVHRHNWSEDWRLIFKLTLQILYR